MNYTNGLYIFKIIFYRDIYFNEYSANFNYSYTLGKNDDVFLKSFNLTTSPQTDNFHINNMT